MYSTSPERYYYESESLRIKCFKACNVVFSIWTILPGNAGHYNETYISSLRTHFFDGIQPNNILHKGTVIGIREGTEGFIRCIYLATAVARLIESNILILLAVHAHP